MRIRRRLSNPKPSAFNVPLAGLWLSVVTFVLGTLVPTIYTQLTFSGIAIQQPSDVRTIFTTIEGLPPFASTRERVTFSTLLKIANANKDAALLEKIEGESFWSKGTHFEFLDADVYQIEADSNGKFKFEFPIKAEIGDPTSQLPLLLKPESQQVLAISLWYKADTRSYADSSELSEKFSAYVEASRLKMSLRLSGKQRDYSLQTGSWARYQQDRAAPSPEELARRHFEHTLLQLIDEIPKDDLDTRRKAEELLKKIEDPAIRRKAEEALKKTQDPGSPK